MSYNKFKCPKCGNEQHISIALGEEQAVQTCIKCGAALVLECCGECEHCEKKGKETV